MKISRLLWLIIVFLISSFPFSGNLAAQDDVVGGAPSDDYIPTVSAVTGDLIAPNTARDILMSQGLSESWDYEGANEIYRAREDSRLIEIAKSLGHDPEFLDEISHDNYIRDAYLFVRNGVEYTPLFGLHHGAMGAAFYKSGTAFDQVSLFSELLHINEVPHSINVGSLTLTEEQLLSLLSVSSPVKACEMLKNGGIPAVFDGGTECASLTSELGSFQGVTIAHAWVTAEYGGQSRVLDPSHKVYDWSEGREEFRSLLMPTQTEIRSSIGGVVNVAEGEYFNPNPVSLQIYLDERVASLASNGGEDALGTSTYDLIGGRRMKIQDAVPQVDSEKYEAWPGLSSISQLPKELKVIAYVDVALPGVVPTSQKASGEETLSVDVFLEKIGVDPLILSPINLTSPDSSYNFSGTSVGQDAFSTFELSILRPGSEGHYMIGDTGYGGGGGDASLRRNEPSGDNLVLIEYAQREAYNSKWLIEIEVNAPYAGDGGDYADMYVRKAPDYNTASIILIGSSSGSSDVGAIYERFLPKKSNVFYGLFVNDNLSLIQCERSRSGRDPSGRPDTSSIQLSGCSSSGSRLRARENDTTSGTCNEIALTNEWAAMDEFMDPYILGGDTSGGININTDPSACIADLSSQFPTILSLDKAIRTKSLLANSWLNSASDMVDLYGRVTNSRAQHMLSVGVITSDIVPNFDLSVVSDALEMDVDSQFSISGASQSEFRATAIASGAGLSALEGLLLQKFTGSPRVDSAVSKADWYAWNGDYDPASGFHYGPYASVTKKNGSIDRLTSRNGIARYYITAGSGGADGVSGIAAVPGVYQLGPSEATEWNNVDTESVRSGRKGLVSRVLETDKVLVVSHLIDGGIKGGSGAKVPQFKSPEFDEEALSQESYEAMYGKFEVDGNLGYLSFTPNAFISVGHDYNSLSLSASYRGVSSSSGPFGQGWSHNHDGKVVLSTNLDAAYSGVHIQPVLPSLIAAASSISLSDFESYTIEEAAVLPQSLMIHGWLARTLYENEAQITFSGGSAAFYNLPDIGYVNPHSSTMSLKQNGSRRIYEGIRPYYSDEEKTNLRRIPVYDREHVPGYSKINTVRAEQYFDYSQMSFEFTSSDKAVYSFERVPVMLTDQTNISCWPDEDKPFISGYSENSYDFCGSGAGAFQIKSVQFTDGRKLMYTYLEENAAAPVSSDSTSSETESYKIGTVLDRVDLVSSSGGVDTLLSSLKFEYDVQFGIRFRLRNLSVGLDEGNGLGANNSRQLLIPDPALTHGQFKFINKVYWSDASVDIPVEASFEYDRGEYGGRYSPLLKSYTDRGGNKHQFDYTDLSNQQLSDYNTEFLLHSFTPASLDAPIFSIEHSPLGRVTSLTDAEGREVKYGVNGVVNTVTDAAGAETTNLYDSQGRLVSTIAPEYTVSEPQ